MNSNGVYSPFDSRNMVGYISEVTSLSIKIHFPDSKLLNRFNYHGDYLHGGIVGSFVAIEGETKGFMGKIVKLSLPEKERMNISESNYKTTDSLHPVGIVEILYSFDLLSYKPKRSIQDYPPISSKVYVCNSELYVSILKNLKKKEQVDDELEIGRTLGGDEIVSLSANDIFSRHCAILGTTGGGKSYTISKIIEELSKKNDAKMVLLDATGEFAVLDEELKDTSGESIIENAIFNNGRNSTFFSYKKLLFEDMCAFFRPAGQSQLPMLEEAIKVLGNLEELAEKYEGITHPTERLNKVVFKKESRNNAWFDQIIGQSPICIEKMDIKSLPLQLNLGCVKTDISGFGGKDSWMLQNTQSLIYRVKGFNSNLDCINIFNINSSNEDLSQDLLTKLDNFLSSENTNKLFRIDLSNIPEDGKIKEIIVNAIGRYFLNRSQSKEEDKNFKKKPVILFVDEAHLFLNKTINDEYSIDVQLNSFDRIAKECRKFGLFLCLSTQRPRDIPEGVLSQIGTFIVHRLINEKDKQAVENASSSYSKEFLNFLPGLGEGEVVIMGVNFLTTLFLQILLPKIEPDSNTPKLFPKQISE